MTDAIELFDGKGQATQNRFEKVGIANETEVGKVYAIDSSFVVETYHAVGSEVVEVFVLGCELVVVLLPDCVESVDLIVGVVVETAVGEVGVFDEKHGHVGMGVAYDFEEGCEQGVNLLHVDVGNAVENYQARVGNGSDDIGNLKVELTVAAEAEVDDLAVEATLEDVGVGHAGPVGATALQDACAIHNDGFADFGQIDFGEFEGRAGRCADINAVDAVVERQVEEVFAHDGIHVGNDTRGGVIVVDVGAGRVHESPCAVGLKRV